MDGRGEPAVVPGGEEIVADAGQDYPRPPVVIQPEEFIYNADQPPDVKFRKLAQRLNQFGDLFRHPEPGAGLIRVIAGPRPRQLPVTTNNDLLAVVNDRLRITVVADGKLKGGRIPTADSGSMLKSEVFLQGFPPLDRVIEHQLYLPSWVPTPPGVQRRGPGPAVLLRRRRGAGLPGAGHDPPVPGRRPVRRRGRPDERRRRRPDGPVAEPLAGR
jgi:hypothetical protein